MKRGEIRIDRLQVRLRHGDAGDVRRLGKTLGGDLLQQVGMQVSASLDPRAARIAHLDAGTLSVTGLAPGEHGAAIARQVAQAIGARLDAGQNRKR